MPSLLGNAGALTGLPRPDAVPILLLAPTLIRPLSLGILGMLPGVLSYRCLVGLPGLGVALLARCDTTGLAAVPVPPIAAPADDEPGRAPRPLALDDEELHGRCTGTTRCWTSTRVPPMKGRGLALCPRSTHTQPEVPSGSPARSRRTLPFFRQLAGTTPCLRHWSRQMLADPEGVHRLQPQPTGWGGSRRHARPQT